MQLCFKLEIISNDKSNLQQTRTTKKLEMPDLHVLKTLEN